MKGQDGISENLSSLQRVPIATGRKILRGPRKWAIWSWAVAILPILAILLLAIVGSVRAGGFPAIELANGATLGGGGTLNLPLPTGSGGISAGDLLIVALASEDNADPMGCNLGGPDAWIDVASFSGYVTICARTATGSETVFSISNPSGLIAGQSFRIVGWIGGEITGGKIAAEAIRDTGSAAPNPPALDPAGWDVEPTLWIVGGAIANNGQAWDITTPPTGFTIVRYDDGTDQSIASAMHTEEVASMNPGAFGTTSAGNAWQAWTIAVRPSTDIPLVTLAATAIGSNRAILNGRLDILFGSSVDLGFQWGDTPSFGNWTANVTRSATGTYAIILSGLNASTLYYFRAISLEVPSGYANVGSTLNFTTLAGGNDIVSIGFDAFWAVIFTFLCVILVVGAWKIREWAGR